MELINELPIEIHFNVIKFMRHPTAEILKPSIDKYDVFEYERAKCEYSVQSNFAADFFSIRDVERIPCQRAPSHRPPPLPFLLMKTDKMLPIFFWSTSFLKTGAAKKNMSIDENVHFSQFSKT